MAALEYVKKGIRINAIFPGSKDTSLTQSVPAVMLESGYGPEGVSLRGELAKEGYRLETINEWIEGQR